MASTKTFTLPSGTRTSRSSNVSPIHTRNTTTLSPSTSQSPISPISSTDYQRSASYTYISTAVKEKGHNIFSIKGSFSEDDLIAQEPQSQASSGWNTPEEYVTGHGVEEFAGDLMMSLRERPTISVSDLEEHDAMSQEAASRTSSATGRLRQRSSVSTNTSTSFQRGSWHSIATTPDSRSPSPSKKKDPEPLLEDDMVVKADSAPSELPVVSKAISVIHEDDDPMADEQEEQSRPATARRSSIFRGRRSLSSLFSRNEESSDNLPVPSIPMSFSTDRLATYTSGSAAVHRAAEPPRLGPTERIEVQSAGSSRRKDELWSVFRTLDADCSKFTSKSSALKANVVRNCLLPFLRQYADHPSTYLLRPEDLERRANILNKWWTAMIEMLHGRNNSSVSGTDRPAVLDGLAGIMARPEWRLYPSPFSPLDRQIKDPQLTRNQSKTSLASNPLQQSVQHNVRNIFVQNLRSQMAFVVDKMSLKNASASLVTFCGKACAYAFMFVPGMADVLVRLWDLKSDILRRVLSENGVDRFGNLSKLSDDILCQFPACLHELKFTTLPEFNRKLRTPPPLPMGTTNIEWWGHWLERWTGHESDLFYVFVKYYHILVSDFLHAGSTREQRMCVPGMLLVHAQILNNLDATIHRQLGKAAVQDLAAAAQALDDVLADPDAIASTLPIPPINATRHIVENRLIMLVRDFLSHRASSYPAARQLFAETFNDLLQATTRGIEVYDSAACYTLLELLEEALVILVNYEQLGTGAGSLITPEFWHLMSRRMISSENTLIEIRLYAFLYTVWDTVVCDYNRKADLCLGLLLDQKVFASRFNHWSPMVRAYYMRLLCWRVGRFDGDALPGDFKILETLLERLQTTWSHYLWSHQGKIGEVPLAAPCNPAPYRRLRIIRTDAQPAPSFHHTFDVIAPPMPPPAQSRLSTRRQPTLSTLSSVAELESRPDEDGAVSTSPTGIRGLFWNVRASRSRSSSRGSNSASTPPMAGGVPIPSRRDSLPASIADDLISSADSSLNSGTSTPTNTSQHGTFKFAFEHNLKITQPNPLRLIPPRLPAPAQRFLTTTSERCHATYATAMKEPRGIARKRLVYSGRALAEWALIVGECHKFFERRRHEGIAENRYVETPRLCIEVFKH